ncbi:MAG: hypothetical protein MZV64_39650 [Ignavibacteriales bacterium]|nr:hypothetical protein [Ignavibacteriales bacterium]
MMRDIGDIFIAARNIGTAFDGDLVEVELFARQKGKNIEGQIIKVAERKTKRICWRTKKIQSLFILFLLTIRQIHRDIYVDQSKLTGAVQGDKVVVGKFDLG